MILLSFENLEKIWIFSKFGGRRSKIEPATQSSILSFRSVWQPNFWVTSLVKHGSFIDKQMMFFLFCNWGQLTELSMGSGFEAMSIPFAFQTLGWFECQESCVWNLTKLIVCILSWNFPSRFYNRSVNPPWGYATRGCELMCRSQMTQMVLDTLQRHICHGPPFPKQMHPHRMS